jgi:3-methylcrotonyl-CoA carboxylase alpha subunit
VHHERIVGEHLANRLAGPPSGFGSRGELGAEELELPIGRARGEALRCGATVSVFGAQSVHFTVPDPLQREAAGGAASGHVLAPMPGLVKAVFAQAGQAVQAGDRLAVLEAMKMEHALLAARDGIVAEVLVTDGAQVEAGAALVRLEPETAAAEEARA